MSSIAERIQSLVDNEGRPAKHIMMELEISSNALSEWKKGKAKPSSEAIIKLAKHFGVSTDYLLTGEQAHSAATLTSEEQEWISLLHHIPLSERKECIGFVKGYITAQNYKDNEPKQVKAVGK